MPASLSSFISRLNHAIIFRYCQRPDSLLTRARCCKLKVIRRRQNCCIYQHFQNYPVRGQCRYHQNSYALFAIQIYSFLFIARMYFQENKCCRNGRLRKNMKLSCASSVIQISQSTMLRLINYAKRSKGLERNAHGNDLAFSYRGDKIIHRF